MWATPLSMWSAHLATLLCENTIGHTAGGKYTLTPNTSMTLAILGGEYSVFPEMIAVIVGAIGVFINFFAGDWMTISLIAAKSRVPAMDFNSWYRVQGSREYQPCSQQHDR